MSKPWCKHKGSFWTNQGSDQIDTIPAGIYNAAHDERRGAYLKRHKPKTDDLIAIPDSYADKIMAEISDFWQFKEHFKERGFVHKRGVLMHGVPGAGKTATLMQLCSLTTDKLGGIVVMNLRSAHFAKMVLEMIRGNEAERPIMLVLEDIDEWIGHDESEWLSILDGENQIDGVVFAATTNNFDMLSARLRCRPSRFDLVVEIQPPSADIRRAFFAAKEPGASSREREAWVDMTEGMGFAHLKEYIVLVSIYRMDARVAADRLRQLNGAAY